MIGEDQPQRVVRHLRRRLATALARRRDRRRFAAMGCSAGRLNLGCGAHPKPDWINVDLWTGDRIVGDGHALVLNYDLRGGIPLPENACVQIYSSHFLEHLSATDGAALLRECHRVLRPDGTLRTCLPDFARLARAYVEHDASYFAPLYEIFSGSMGDGVPGSETIMDAVNNGLYQFGEHRCMYDMEKLERLLRGIGFRRVTPSSFDPDIDGTWDAREHFSLYVDAIK